MFMFNFFEDLYLEINGFDMEEVARQKKEKIEKEKAETIILKKNTKKILISGCSIVFGLTLVYGFSVLKENNILGIISSVIILLLEIATFICLLIKKKSTEIVAIIGVILLGLIIFGLPLN